MDATFWATIGLLLFLALIVYFGVPKMIGKALDQRAARISNDIEEARKLREEAQQLLNEYKQKRAEAEKEAGEIVAAAKHEAESLVADAKRKTEEYVTRRSELAEQKIAQAERDAVNEVRSRAVDLAVEAAGRVLSGKVDAQADAGLFKASLADVKANFN